MSDTLDPKFVNYLQTLPYVQAHYRKSEYARIAGLPQVQEKLDLLQKTGKLTRRDGKPATTPEEIAWASLCWSEQSCTSPR